MAQVQRRPDKDNVSMAVVEAIADAKGVTPEELTPPLYESIDPEALDSLFRGRETHGEVTVTYGRYRVLVRGPDEVTVEKA